LSKIFHRCLAITEIVFLFGILSIIRINLSGHLKKKIKIIFAEIFILIVANATIFRMIIDNDWYVLVGTYNRIRDRA
jgi:hypothetical protein